MPRRPPFPNRSARFFATLAAGMMCTALVACGAVEPMPVPTSTPSATAIPKGDGVLTIGTLFPSAGTDAAFADAQRAGVELAVREINEAGGVGGEPVVVYHQNSGDNTHANLESSFADLVAKKVDVVVGPSSAELAEQLLPDAVAAGVIMISPSATTTELEAARDPAVLFRMIPSAALEGKALAEAIGKKRVAIIYYSDDAGRALRDEFVAELEHTGGTLAANQGFSSTTNDADKIVSVLKVAKPDVVVLSSGLGAMEKTSSIILAMSAANFGGAKLWLAGQNLPDLSHTLPGGSLTDVNRILEGGATDADFRKRVKSADPTLTDFHFSAEAYDASILAALAAIVVGDDSGRAVGGALSRLSSSGVTCTSFGECVDVLTSRKDINYDGMSGPLSFDEAGDVRSAQYGIYRYEADNTMTFVMTVKVG